MTRKVLIAVDTSDIEGCRIILAEARAYSAQDPQFHLVHVVPEEEALGPLSQFVPDGFAEAHRAEARKSLDELAADLGVAADATLHIRTGNAYIEILDLAENIGADLIIVGASKPELTDFLLGPKAARVVRHAHCSVLVARPQNADAKSDSAS